MTYKYFIPTDINLYILKLLCVDRHTIAEVRDIIGRKSTASIKKVVLLAIQDGYVYDPKGKLRYYRFTPKGEELMSIMNMMEAKHDRKRDVR